MLLFILTVSKRGGAMLSYNHSASNRNGESPRLLDRVRERLRLKHYGLRTETAYLGWIKR